MRLSPNPQDPAFDGYFSGNPIRRAKYVALIFPLAFALASVALAGDVATQHNDNERSGAYLEETALTTQNVNTNQFGLLFTRAVDAMMFAQPLYLERLSIPGKGKRNVVYAVTEHNSVYCFDADDPAEANPLWSVNLGPSVPSDDTSCDNLGSEEGITSTPVIDRAADVIFVVSKTKEEGNYFHRLHALNLATGREMLGGPVQIQGMVEGVGSGSDGAYVRFNPLVQLNRPALLLSDGVVYICFGSECDNFSNLYHGWIFGYDAHTLKQRAILNSTRNGVQGGIWMAGNGPSVDAEGNIYVISGNGTFDGPAYTAKTKADYADSDLGDSLLKLKSTRHGLEVADFFTPTDQAFLDTYDYDFGSIGAIVLPGTKMLIGGGKENLLYLCNQNDLGRFNAADNGQIRQSFRVSQPWTSVNNANWLISSPAYLRNGSAGTLYSWAQNDVLKAFSLSEGQFNETPTSSGSGTASYPGAALAISSNGARAETGIVWAAHSLRNSVTISTHLYPGILRAYDASNLANELWNSEQNHDRDFPGNFSRFAAPTIANGKVYLTTASAQVAVYGLLPSL